MPAPASQPALTLGGPAGGVLPSAPPGVLTRVPFSTRPFVPHVDLRVDPEATAVHASRDGSGSSPMPTTVEPSFAPTPPSAVSPAPATDGGQRDAPSRPGAAAASSTEFYDIATVAGDLDSLSVRAAAPGGRDTVTVAAESIVNCFAFLQHLYDSSISGTHLAGWFHDCAALFRAHGTSIALLLRFTVLVEKAVRCSSSESIMKEWAVIQAVLESPCAYASADWVGPCPLRDAVQEQGLQLALFCQY